MAAELGIQHRPEGVTVCGTPIGTDAYVAETLSQRAGGVISQVHKLMRLQLPKQSQFALLRASLSLRMAHLQRNLPWAQVVESTRAVEGAILEAAAAVFHLPACDDPARACGTAGREREQMTLPLRHGGFGLRVVTAVEADAALASGAAKAQAAMAQGPAACRPFEGASRAPLLETWRRVFDDVAADCKWEPDARDLPEDFVRDVLPRAQHDVGLAIGNRAGAAFLGSFDLATDAGRHDAARMRSVGCGPASAWVTALPGPNTSLMDADMVMAGRHRLGLGVPSSVPVPLCTCGEGRAAAADHAMACKRNAGWATLRHNLVVSTVRRALSAAGFANSAEPPYHHTCSASDARGAAAGQRRGDVLAVGHGNRVFVLDCVITHPAAASYVQEASRTDGAAAKRAEGRKTRQIQAFGAGSAFEFVPLACESYGRLGAAATRFLGELGDVVEASGRGSKAIFMRNVRTEISVALCRGNARMYYSTLSMVAQRVGRGFQPGCEVPCEDLDGL